MEDGHASNAELKVKIKTLEFESRPTNRLAREKSPYLLQHQFNPVDWFAWGDEAFAKARRENRPLFLSIGYSTCHWCHVMERESFENEAIAAFLNAHFVSIKVDREERPDVDKIYMTFVQATTGQGGWPLNVFLTPDLKPFFGGTYFPPDNRHGRSSFLHVLQQIQGIWEKRPGDIAHSAADIHTRLKEATAGTPIADSQLNLDTLRRAAALFMQSFDPRNGGFGGAPKFPQPSTPQLLLRYARRFDDTNALHMVLQTCDQMAEGGIHDQLGGGFARYSVDAEWLVPHFEKMLYDNAQLAQLYLDAYLLTSEQKYATVVRDILDYVLRDMTHPEGGFFSAEDADSEGHEGKFYCWTLDEITNLLNADEAALAIRYFGISRQGNFVDHSHPQPLLNQNVLSIADRSLSLDEEKLLNQVKQKLLRTRALRVRPHRDDKVLASWNGLMLGAMARAGVVLNAQTYRDAALNNFQFLKARLWDAKTKTLYHRWREGEHDHVQLLEAYASLLTGVIELYEAQLRPGHLEFALNLADSMLSRFYDREQGGFWQSGPEASELILRLKDDYDGAEPAGNSLAVMALLKLGRLAGREEFTAAARKTLDLNAQRLNQLPQAVSYMLQALDFSLEEPRRAVLAGEPESASGEALLQAVHSVYQPNKVVLGNRGPVEDFAKNLPVKRPPVVYVCTGTECKPPSSDPDELKNFLK